MMFTLVGSCAIPILRGDTMKHSILFALMLFLLKVSATATDVAVTAEEVAQQAQGTSGSDTLAPYILGGLVLVIGLLIGIAKSKRGVD